MFIGRVGTLTLAFTVGQRKEDGLRLSRGEHDGGLGEFRHQNGCRYGSVQTFHMRRTAAGHVNKLMCGAAGHFAQPSPFITDDDADFLSLANDNQSRPYPLQPPSDCLSAIAPGILRANIGAFEDCRSRP